METSQGYIVAATPPSLPLKRKRGRPRKDRSLEHGEYACISRKVQTWKNHSQLHSTGFTTQPHEETSGTGVNDAMVGLPVTGVIDATFDAGYLLTVTVGDTGRVLKGIVFKPGLYIPVSPENDVAPNVQMIKRKNITFPSENTSNTPRYGTVFPSNIRGHSTWKGKEVSPTTQQIPISVEGAANVATSRDAQALTPPSARSDHTALPCQDTHQFTEKLINFESHQSKYLEQPVFSSSSPKRQAEISGVNAGGVRNTVEFLSNTAEATWPVSTSMNECRRDGDDGRIMELLQAMQENRNDE